MYRPQKAHEKVEIHDLSNGRVLSVTLPVSVSLRPIRRTNKQNDGTIGYTVQARSTLQTKSHWELEPSCKRAEVKVIYTQRITLTVWVIQGGPATVLQ